MAGSTGLEPVLYATKKRCITIMLRPNVCAIYDEIERGASQKIGIFTCFITHIRLGQNHEKI